VKWGSEHKFEPFRKAAIMKRRILYLIFICNLSIAVSYAEEIKITSIEPEFASSGDEITIKGSGFNVTDEKGNSMRHPSAYVRFFYEYTNFKQETVKIEEWRAEIRRWRDDNIIAKVPFNAKPGIVYVQVHNGEGISSEPKEFWIKRANLAEMAKILKKSGMLDSNIVDHLFHKGKQRLGANSEVEDSFGNTSLTADEIYELKQCGFQDEFIAKLEGHPQYVSLGIAPIWLTRTANLAYAPIVRVLLIPRSYFYDYRPYISWPFGFFQLDRWDLNFGYTNRTSTTESNEIKEKKSYALIGLSNQLNRSSLLNIGFALVPGDIEGVETQIYIGFTVDYNLLKGIGVVSK
jgi:hypothetical protein